MSPVKNKQQPAHQKKGDSKSMQPMLKSSATFGLAILR